MKQTPLTGEQIAQYDRMANHVGAKTAKRIEFLAWRTRELSGLTADKAAFAGMTNRLAAVLAQPKDDEQRKARALVMFELCDLVDRARRNIPEAQTELAALRTEAFDLYVRAKSNFLMFFAPVNLAPNEQACYIHTYRNPVSVGYMAQDGSGRSVKAVRAQKQSYFDMLALTTDEVRYPIRDYNLGPDIAAMAQATVDLAWEMDLKVNALAKAMFLTLLGSFTTTGAKLDRTYVPNDQIETDNLPTTNLLVADDVPNSSTTFFRLDVIRKIMKYCTQWGDVWGEPINPTGVILIPSLDSTDLSQELKPTGQAFNVTADSITGGNYMRFSWFDRLWTLVPDVTLAPGVCYPVLSRPVGQVFFKPQMDEEFVETNRKKNVEARSMVKPIQFASAQPMRVNAAKVTYRS